MLSLIAAGAYAQEDPLASLKSALRNDVSAQNMTHPTPSGRLSAEQSALYTLDRMPTDDPARMEETLRQLLATDLPDPLRAQVSAVLQKIQQARAARAKTFENEVAMATQKAGAALLKAQKASELDPVLTDLRRTVETGRTHHDSDVSGARNQADRAVRFVQTWQDYLWDMESGKFGNAVQKLSNLAQGDEVLTGIGRSLLLERRRAAEEAERNQSKGVVSRAMQNVKTLDDLPGAMAQLRGDPSGNRSTDVQAALNALEPIYKTYTAYKNGWAATLPLSYFSGSEIDPAISRLRTELFLRVLPRTLGIEGKMEPASGETVEQYLTRIRQNALKTGDYDLLGRTVSATRDLSMGLAGQADLSFAQDYGAFLSLREAQNDERARRFVDAVMAYRSALRIGSAAIPAEIIGQRLNAIEKDQPEEYRRAMEILQHNDGREFHHPMPEPARPLALPPVSPAPSAAAPPSSASPARSPHA
jgi:hypothetical protein